MRAFLTRHRHQAPSLPSSIVVSLAVLFAGLTFVRGLGWLTSTDKTLSTVITTGLSHAWLTPDRWGVTLMATGVLVVAAYCIRIHVLVFLAHGLAAVVYLTVFVALAQAVAELGSGLQHVGAPFGGLVWHTLLAWLTGPLPPRLKGPRGAN